MVAVSMLVLPVTRPLQMHNATLTRSYAFAKVIEEQSPDCPCVSRMILSSSMAEHSAVNRRVVGSSPTSGAI